MGQEKVAKLGIKREKDLMYYLKKGDVWASPRKRPGQPKGKAVKIAEANVQADYDNYLYFIDKDGDVARKERQVGGTKRKKKASGGKKGGGKKGGAKKSAPKKGAKKAGGKKGKKKK